MKQENKEKPLSVSVEEASYLLFPIYSNTCETDQEIIENKRLTWLEGANWKKEQDKELIKELVQSLELALDNIPNKESTVAEILQNALNKTK